MSQKGIWGGVRPQGKRKIRSRHTFLMGLIGIMIAEWALWLVYRYLSYPIIESAFSRLGFLFHIIAAPTIGLIPIFLFWRYVMKEKGIPWKFTRKNLFSSVMVGAVAAALLMILYQGASWLVLFISGYGIPAQTYFISLWRSSDWDWFILMTFTFFFIVGPVEELQYRSFLQDQIGRVFKPSTGLLIASALFALSHLPIYFIVYKLDIVQAGFTLCWTFTMGSVLGIFYFQSRNIMGPIIMHGLWDWILSVYVLDIGVKESYMNIGYLSQILWLAALIPMAVLTIIFINIFYVALWKERRPEGSFGVGPVPIINNFVVRAGRSLRRSRITGFLKKNDSMDSTLSSSAGRSTLGVVIVCLTVMVFSFPGDTVDLSFSANSQEGDEFQNEEQEITLSFDDGYYINEGERTLIPLDINETSLVSRISMSILWTEENDGRFWMVNEPDTFRIGILAGEEDSSMEDDSGSISIIWEDISGNTTFGDLEIYADCIEAGNIHPRFVDLTGLREEEDTGNDVTISIQITYVE